jgi:signal transduction histidine kinase
MMAKILIVDDMESNLLALGNVLKSEAAEIIKAASGDEALRACLNHDIALAILDVQMPVMDGYELATLLRGDPRTKTLPIIFLSAVYSEDPYVFKGYSSGAVDFITKPFIPEILLSKVRVFLELDAQKNEIMQQKASLERMVGQLEEQIEARKKAEQELLKARMLEALGTLAGGIAHDFNNMLAALLGQIELARDSTGNDARVYDFLGQAEETILRATDLTSKFLTFSGGGKPRKQPIDVRPMLKNSALAALIGADVVHEFSFQEDLWRIEADRRQMNQVIYILITNAREAMPRGGTLSIRATNWEAQAGKDTTSRSIQPGPYVDISVTDQGPGIPAENLAKIFDPYFSTKKRGSLKGMGLGLTIAHSIITRHDGYIQADSREGAGSSFHIYLPALK